MLPDWADEAMMHGSGVLEAEGFIARHFGLRILPDGGFVRPALPQALFKLSAGTLPADVADTRAFATTVARWVALATPTAWSAGRLSAKSVRTAALACAGSRACVDLPALVEASWNAGVPVVYLPDLPSTPKPDGLVTYVAGRPVVVLTKKSKAPDWALFILAHEWGHLALGHLDMIEGAAVVDQKVEAGSGDNGSEDEQEQAANRFASSVVSDGKILTFPKLINAEELAAAGLDYGRKHGISPGHVVLNAARHSGMAMGRNLFPLGNKALAVIAKHMDQKSTAEVCTDAARRHLDMEKLSDDTVEFLEKLKVI